MHSNRRYRPYPPRATPVLRPPPAPSPQTRQLLKTAREQLDFYNSAGVLVTWAGNDWELVSRLTRKTANSSILVGAASFPSVPNFSYPRCPHLDAQGHPYAPMELNLGKKVNNIQKDFFKAGDHICDFIVVIPKVRPTVYSTSEDDDEPSPSSPTLSSSLSSIDEVDVNWNPCVPASTSTTPATSPISSPTPTPLGKKRAFIHTSRFSESVSAARALSVNPSSHLAFPRPGASTHRVLQPYDEAFNPGCLQRTFQELQFLHTDVGQALRALNSTMGVTFDIIQEIIRDCTDCTVCKCQFSHDGFNRHIRGGFCWNRPQPTAVTPKPSVERLPHELAIRELPPGKQLGTEAEFLRQRPPNQLEAPQVWVLWLRALWDGFSFCTLPSCEIMSQPPPVQLFDFDLARTQAQQRELTVYSYSLVGLMELYWPTANGVPLSPVELVHFIQDQGLHWTCFCSHIEHRPVSSSIILEGESGFVYCHYAQARCSFFSAHFHPSECSFDRFRSSLE
ncbi:hypothetical protein B0H14DRAFT_3449630 [Mycena olivaceomarginata]|nr:hypothetical protein B0H14DRAFT_3449630 [Mycena olivaceomarginata]